MDLLEIGEKVREARKEKGMTQADLASAAGISRVRVNRIETGAVFEVGFGTIMSILESLDLTMRVGSGNAGRPTLDDIMADAETDDMQP